MNQSQEALRISSCDVLTVDDFLKAMIATEKQVNLIFHSVIFLKFNENIFKKC